MSELQLLRNFLDRKCDLKPLLQFLDRKSDLSREFDSPSVKLKASLCDAICMMAEAALPRGLAPTRSVVAEIIAEKIKLLEIEDGHDVDYMREEVFDASLDIIDRQHGFFQLGFLVRLASTFDIKINVGGI